MHHDTPPPGPKFAPDQKRGRFKFLSLPAAGAGPLRKVNERTGAGEDHENMRLFFHLMMQGFFVALKKRWTGLFAPSEFVCAQCERAESCGFPPSETCMVRLAQLAREPDKYR